MHISLVYRYGHQRQESFQTLHNGARHEHCLQWLLCLHKA
jgi:hypothetical protein